jgi:hypothetical protein
VLSLDLEDRLLLLDCDQEFDLNNLFPHFTAVIACSPCAGFAMSCEIILPADVSSVAAFTPAHSDVTDAAHRARATAAIPDHAASIGTCVRGTPVTTLAPDKVAFSTSGGTGNSTAAATSSLTDEPDAPHSKSHDAHDLTKIPSVGALPGLFAPLQWMSFGAVPTNAATEQPMLPANEKALIVRRQLSAPCTTGAVTTLAGSGGGTFADGTGTAASFWSPMSVAYSTDGSTIAVADYFNHRVRLVVVAMRSVTTLAGSGSATFTDGIGTARPRFVTLKA